MSKHSDFGLLPFVVFGIWVFGSIIYEIVKYQGLAASGLKARIERTVGRVRLVNGMKVEVHRLDRKSPARAVGVVLIKTGVPVLAMAFSAEDAEQLADLLEYAAGSGDVWTEQGSRQM